VFKQLKVDEWYDFTGEKCYFLGRVIGNKIKILKTSFFVSLKTKTGGGAGSLCLTDKNI
jgi:hypothetical protein